MSTYYYSFVPGFNAWYIVWPLLVAATAFIGGLRYHLDEEWRIRSTFSAVAYMLLLAVMEIALVVMFVAESWNGLLQFCLNALIGNESPFWAIILAVLALEVVTVVFGLSLLYAGYYGSTRQISVLKSDRRRHFREERERMSAPKLRVIKSSRDFFGPEIEWFSAKELVLFDELGIGDGFDGEYLAQAPHEAG